jgi:Txe/YoeB family toxin of toxin-antitoxin system
MWELLYSKVTQKDSLKVAQYPALRRKVESLLALMEMDPFQSPPRYEKLSGNYTGLYSRRINIQHRLVYQVLEEVKVVKILAMWTHYA